MERYVSAARVSLNEFLLRLSGQWKMEAIPCDLHPVFEALQGLPKGTRVTFHCDDVSAWDSTLVTFLVRVRGCCDRNGLSFDSSGLPDGVDRILALATAVPERKGARRGSRRESFLSRVGEEAVAFSRATVEILGFIGEVCVALMELFRGKAGFRLRDLLDVMEDSGARALPIVSLISLLVGLILAFVGAVQLMVFGAQIYVASLVGIAMVRVMGAVMAGIIMAGRTGAAFAAQLGTMQVNEEIDALKTLGVSPMRFLVLPRIVGLSMMMPLLCLYADLMGFLGGLIVGVTMLDLNAVAYYKQTIETVGTADLWVGLFQSAVFGVLVAVAGCLRGIQCGRSASAVGDATTSAVVTGIVSIVVATALITVMCNSLGI